MGRYNEILVGRYNRFFQKLLQMKGGAVAPQLAGDLQPSIGVFSGVENRYLEGWNRFIGQFFVGATVGQTNGAQLRNPIGSNVIVVVERFNLSSTTIQELDWGYLTTGVDLAFSLGTGVPLDARGNQNSVAQISTANNSPAASTQWRVLVNPASATYEQIQYENEELTLLPGQVIRITETQVNTALYVNMLWRERFLEESERT